LFFSANDGTNGTQLWKSDGTTAGTSRERADYTTHYPELAVLRSLPEGTLVDGELVALRGGIPDLGCCGGVISSWTGGRFAVRDAGARYAMFSSICCITGGGVFCASRWPRREMLAKVCGKLNAPEVLFSEAVVGMGQALFQAIVAQGHEGVVAKHVESAYRPGERTSAWRKIKPAREDRPGDGLKPFSLHGVPSARWPHGRRS
jgi:bifunctional non-homologous end joining protein LigD